MEKDDVENPEQLVAKDDFKFTNRFWFRGDGMDPWAPGQAGNLLWKHYDDHKSVMLESEFH